MSRRSENQVLLSVLDGMHGWMDAGMECVESGVVSRAAAAFVRGSYVIRPSGRVLCLR